MFRVLSLALQCFQNERFQHVESPHFKTIRGVKCTYLVVGSATNNSLEVTCLYFIGRVMARYRSIEMAQRLRIDEVHSHTSTASQILQKYPPNGQAWNTSSVIE